MSLHQCPIEPDDWSDGPNYLEGDCPDCDGTGSIDEGDDQGGEKTCAKCGGSGFVDHEPEIFGDEVI